MAIKSILIPMSLCLGLTAGAQTVGFKISLPDNQSDKDTKVFVSPANNPSEATAELTRTGDAPIFTGDINASPDGLYYIYSQNSTSQASTPIYVDPSDKTVDFSFTIDGYHPSTSLSDNSNRAIAAFNASVIDKSIELGKHATELSPEQLKTIFSGYISEADSIIASAPLPSRVEEFMRIWAYTSAADAYNLTQYFCRRTGKSLGVNRSDFLPAAHTALDTPLAEIFPTAASTIVSDLEGKTLEEKLDNLYSTYKTQTLKDKAAATLLQSFISSFDYTDNFDEGLARLTAITDKYSLPDSYIATFKARRATVAGAPFPDVTLVDREGNTVDFSKFRGKYVYVDLWASWCGPCCREVPYLQELEKEFENSNVAFVSISIDSTKAPWIKKMDQLNMHGNQLFNSDGKLPEKLNVSGIPHFLIYDPEGRLYAYKATRPSDPKTKELLQSLK